ncbi:MAG: tRNA dihydrouridine(20/20a) synthase DusA [Gammaproteobacteria bacterium RIFCSPHIGHO2_12_FULL_45_9]|nr:MAG: tRNA dihydrouridine(20/20a) synthase DusA [Gammaproteobacteria bacterium RIFCSPHIGHO2_12_FULL_45_9]
MAPMMEWTDRHFRWLLRQITQQARLYTEMVTAMAIRHGDVERLLAFSPCEHPIALQLGGSDPALLAFAARAGEAYHYDEINLNVGCPSPRVSSGRFGACLMKEPSLVAECVQAMREVVAIPVTVKTRIGVDDIDSYDALTHLMERIQHAGCDVVIVHARKAWLQGLSPKENREIPPIQYDTVYRLKQDFPEMTFVLNGGIQTHAAVEQHLIQVDGVMLGRVAYAKPMWFSGVDRLWFGEGLAAITDPMVVQAYLDYMHEQLGLGVPLRAMSKHLMGFFQGVPGAREWRRKVGEKAKTPADWQKFLGSVDICQSLRCVNDL